MLTSQDVRSVQFEKNLRGYRSPNNPRRYRKECDSDHIYFSDRLIK